MSYSVYPNQFNFNDNGTYKGLDAIKGDSGDSAGFGAVTASVDNTSGTPTVTVTTSGPNTAKNINFAFSGIKGEGIGGGTFAPLVSFSSAQPTSAENNTIWMKDCSAFSVGEIMLGNTNSQPSTRPNGTALQSGDVYVIGGKSNNHPIVWGNVTFYPFRTWVYNGSAWVYKDAECKSGGSWWPMNSEWFVENGVIIGSFAYPSSGTKYFEVSTVNDVLIMTVRASGTSSMYLNVTAGTNVDISTDPFTNVMEGTLRCGETTYAGAFGALNQSTGGDTGNHSTVGTVSASVTIAANASVVNPITYCHMGSTSGSSQATVGFYVGVTSTSEGMVGAEIKNWYRVFGDITSV